MQVSHPGVRKAPATFVKIKTTTICGPISYNPVKGIADIREYHLAFRAIRKDWKILSSWRTLTSLKWDKKILWAEKNHREELIQLAFQNILVSDNLIFIPGWTKSYGCMLEYAVGISLKRQLMEVDNRLCPSIITPGLRPNPIVIP